MMGVGLYQAMAFMPYAYTLIITQSSSCHSLGLLAGARRFFSAAHKTFIDIR